MRTESRCISCWRNRGVLPP